MKDLLLASFESMGITLTPFMTTSIILALIFVISVIIHLVLHHLIKVLAAAAAKTRQQWDDVFFKHKLFHHLALTLQGVILYVQARIWLEPGSHALPVIEVLTHLWILLYSLLSLFSLLNTLQELAFNSPSLKQLPLRGIFQSIKLAASLVVLILAIALLIGKSPLILFSGLGAMTAVLLLVFKD